MRLAELIVIGVVVSAMLSGCASSRKSAGGGDSAKLVAFRFVDSNNDQFIARTSDPDLIEQARAQLALPRDQRTLHINGELARGNGGFNQPWSWHIVDNNWVLTEISMELCDGTAQLVEANLDYWIDDVGRFCPWSSVVLSEY